MLLRKFEAYGFKSFAEKLELEFGQGITAIVGPNGSGKSNIADGIRWALGEQSVKNLRGAKMEDVIFAGSTKRRALGVAEVSLTFDNSDGILPLDYREVIITRRVFRSGESEYYVNKNLCRLKDIQDILADTGLGKEAMAVIGQNKVDEILNSKPEERRLLFEEAAGITKYKLRKKEALRKLDDTNNNLTRIRDITAEIETQLEPLKESAARTGKYNELAKLLKACQVTLVLTKVTKARQMVESAEAEQLRLTDEDIAVSTKLTLNETENEKVIQKVRELNEKTNEIDKKIMDTSTSIERIDGQVGVLNERIIQYERAIERNIHDIDHYQAQQAEINEKVQNISSNFLCKQSELNLVKESLCKQENEQRDTNYNIEQIEQLIDAGKEKSFDQMQELVTYRNEYRTAERDKALVNTRFAHLTADVEKDKSDLLQKEQNISNLKEQIDQLVIMFENVKHDKDCHLKNYKELQIKLEHLKSEENRVTDKYNQICSRQKVLSAMQGEYEGFGKGIKSILKSTVSWRKEICGAVAEIISVADKYVTAVEISLGGAMQYVVTEQDDVAKKAIDYLKVNHLGRATFLPLNTIKSIEPRSSEVFAAKGKGALGFAADLVSCEDKYRKVINFLLGRTIVAEDIDSALKIAKQNMFKIKLVTLEGELINPGGSLTGGSIYRRDASFLSRTNEIAVCNSRINLLKSELSTLKDHMSEMQAKITGLTESIATLDSQRREIEIKQAELAIHLEREQKDIIHLKLSIRTVADELELCGAEQIRIDKRITDLAEKINQMQSIDSEHKLKVSELQNQLKELQSAKEQAAAAITDSKITLSSVTQELATMNISLEECKADKQLIVDQLLTLEQEKNELMLEVEKAKATAEKLKNTRFRLVEDNTSNMKQRDIWYAEKLELHTVLQSIDKELKETRRKANIIQTRLHEVQLLSAKYKYEVSKLSEQLCEQYKLSEDEAREIAVPGNVSEITGKIHELEVQVAQLGPINPAAIGEYERLRERFDFLQVQSQDLLSAKEYLNSVIQDIDKNMSKQFHAAFKEINQYFGDIFARLFGGGSAFLQLVEPSSILDTGVEIIVQPPGKKLQNLALLSGGERALTVIALLFALLKFRPAPFCVLDEIDAALDEANVDRFGNFLKDYAQNTQFIVVTHRKGTMEAADVMHGVTMEESGISKLLSVKFMENAG